MTPQSFPRIRSRRAVGVGLALPPKTGSAAERGRQAVPLQTVGFAEWIPAFARMTGVSLERPPVSTGPGYFRTSSVTSRIMFSPFRKTVTETLSPGLWARRA